jgi:hypothetical protein
MKKQPLEFFRNDPWWVRLIVLVIVRVICPLIFLSMPPILKKVFLG